MDKAITAQDERYEEIFDLTHGEDDADKFTGDLTIRMNALREKGSVLEGGIGALLGRTRDAWTTPRKAYTFLTFKTCDAAFRDDETYANSIYKDLDMVRGYGDTILWMDGEEHRRYRAVAQPLFLLQSAQKWWKTNWGDEIVTTLLDNIEKKERSDLNMDLCVRLPMQLITQAYGMSGDLALEFREQLDLSVGVIDCPADVKQAAADKVDDMLRELVGERRRNPQDDIISKLVAADLKTDEGSRKLTDEEVFGYCRVVMHAGGGTTWRQLGITILCLLRNGYWKDCLENRDLVSKAIEESIRWMPTDPSMPRLVTRDVEVEGIRIEAGSRVDLCMAAANRDPSRWDDPNTYNPYRSYRYNLGTAVGAHQCMGHSVTRQEMAWAINGLLDRFPNMRIDPDRPETQFIGTTGKRGIDALPVLLR